MMDEAAELIKSGKTDALEQLIKSHTSLASDKTEQGISLLQLSAYYRNSAAVALLRKYRPKLDLFEAASLGDAEQITTMLNEHPESVNSYSADGFTALGLASFFGQLPIVTLLLDNGATTGISANNQYKVTPLHSACAISNYDIAALLINAGADVNAKQMQGVTPLHSAAHNGQTKIAKLLIDNGADVNARMDNGRTRVFMALEKDFQEVANLIKDAGGI